MAIKSVFVYADGQVGLVDLPVDSEPANWRRIIKRASFVSAYVEPTTKVTVETEGFTLRGRMFDGRPIYCADGFDVAEAHQTHWHTIQDWREHEAGVRRELSSSIRKFVREEHPDAIFLDGWEGTVTLTPWEIDDGLDRQNVVKTSVGVLAAFRILPAQEAPELCI